MDIGSWPVKEGETITFDIYYTKTPDGRPEGEISAVVNKHGEYIYGKERIISKEYISYLIKRLNSQFVKDEEKKSIMSKIESFLFENL